MLEKTIVVGFTSVLRLHLLPTRGDVWWGRGGHLIVLFYRNSYYSPPPPPLQPIYNFVNFVSHLRVSTPNRYLNTLWDGIKSKYIYGFGFNGKKCLGRFDLPPKLLKYSSENCHS